MELIDEDNGGYCHNYGHEVRKRPLPEVAHLSVAEEAFAEINDLPHLSIHVIPPCLSVALFGIIAHFGEAFTGRLIRSFL